MGVTLFCQTLHESERNWTNRESHVPSTSVGSTTGYKHFLGNYYKINREGLGSKDEPNPKFPSLIFASFLKINQNVEV